MPMWWEMLKPSESVRKGVCVCVTFIGPFLGDTPSVMGTKDQALYGETAFLGWGSGPKCELSSV